MEELTQEMEETKKVLKKKKEHTGILHIYSSFNNTIANVTDLSGSTVARCTGGMVTKQDRLKANPTKANISASSSAICFLICSASSVTFSLAT